MTILADTTLLTLTRRVTDGDPGALLELCTELGAAVRDQVRAALDAVDDISAVVSATFVEVWWLATFHRGDGTDVRAWVTGIAERRAAELRDAELRDAGQRAGERWAGAMDDRSLWPRDADLVALADLLGDSRTAARARRVGAA